jgi:hypothetical protein
MTLSDSSMAIPLSNDPNFKLRHYRVTVRVKDPLNDGQIYAQHRKTASDASPDIVQDPGARRSPPLPFAMMLSSRVTEQGTS